MKPCVSKVMGTRILESLGNPPSKGALPISLEEARLVLVLLISFL